MFRTAIMLIITIAIATILAYAAHVLAGRLVGMGVTTSPLCSGIMAYFLVPPVYSLRVSQKHDLLVLGLYTTVGLVRWTQRLNVPGFGASGPVPSPEIANYAHRSISVRRN